MRKSGGVAVGLMAVGLVAGLATAGGARAQDGPPKQIRIAVVNVNEFMNKDKYEHAKEFTTQWEGMKKEINDELTRIRKKADELKSQVKNVLEGTDLWMKLAQEWRLEEAKLQLVSEMGKKRLETARDNFRTDLYAEARKVAADIAKDYPSRPIRLVVGQTPGSSIDTMSRIIVARMSDVLGQQIVVDNRTGAGGTIGLAQFVNASRGDAHALMIGGMVMVGGTYLQNSPVTLAQVTPIARLTSEWEVIVVPAGSPHKTMTDLVRAFKANPGAVSWGGGSAGGTDHILVGLIAKAVGVDPAKINYVPFKGGGEAIAAIVGGHVTAGVSGLGEFAEQIKGGRMRALGISAPSAVEGIASLKEQGIDVELFWKV